MANRYKARFEELKQLADADLQLATGGVSIESQLVLSDVDVSAVREAVERFSAPLGSRVLQAMPVEYHR